MSIFSIIQRIQIMSITNICVVFCINNFHIHHPFDSIGFTSSLYLFENSTLSNIFYTLNDNLTISRII